MNKETKVHYLFRVKLAELPVIKRKEIVKRIKKRLNIQNQAFSRRLRGEVNDVTGYELLVWSQELNCKIDDLIQNNVQLNLTQA